MRRFFLGLTVGLVMAVCIVAPTGAQHRTILFSGIPWYVRDTGDRLEGPGPNLWSGDERSVWVDDDGLHLTLREVDGTYRAAEVYTRHPVPGYGTYTFTVETPPWSFETNLVLGLFLYQYRGLDATPQEYELDIEFSRWGHPQSPLGHYTMMYRPAESSGSVIPSHSFDLGGDLEQRFTTTTHQIRWYPGEVMFQSWGNGPDGTRTTIAHHLFSDPRVHPHDEQRLHINLWLFQGAEPTDPADREIVIKEVTLCTEY